MFSRLQTFLLSLGAFLRPKKWNCVCSVDVSATISVCEWCTPLLMKVSTPKHKKVNKKYLPHKFRSFFLAQHFCLFFAFKHTLSPPLYLHHNRHYIASRFTPPLPHPTLDPQIIGTGHETGIASEEAIYLELYTVT
jgi:hypothetical protein